MSLYKEGKKLKANWLNVAMERGVLIQLKNHSGLKQASIFDGMNLISSSINS